MSVIFQTLKKLKNKPQQVRKGAERSRRGRNVYSFKNLFFSTQGILLIVLCAVLFGTGFLYVIRYLEGYLGQGNRESAVLVKGIEEPLKTETGIQKNEASGVKSSRGKNSEVPPPLQAIPPEKSGIGEPAAPRQGAEKPPDKILQPARSLTPQSPDGYEEEVETGDRLVTLQKARDIEQGKQPPGVNEERQTLTLPGPKTGDKETAISQGPTVAYIPPKNAKGAGTLEKEHKAIVQGLSPVIPNIDKGNTKETTSRKVPLKTSLQAKPQEKYSSQRTVESRGTSGEAGEPQARKGDGINSASKERGARIASMVEKMERLVITGRPDQVNDLINQLALVKGEEDTYILKLRAFWQLRQGDYESAASLLTKVLHDNEGDREAGINMAICEIKTNRLIEAKKRLLRLSEAYPEDTTIPNLINKLK